MGNITSELSENTTTQDTSSASSSADMSNINSQDSEINTHEMSSVPSGNPENTNIHETASANSPGNISSEFTSRNLDNVIISSATYITGINTQGIVNNSSGGNNNMVTQETSSALIELNTQESTTSSGNRQHDYLNTHSPLNTNTQESTITPTLRKLQETLSASSSDNMNTLENVNIREPVSASINSVDTLGLVSASLPINTHASSSINTDNTYSHTLESSINMIVSKSQQESNENFKQELEIKHEKRRQLIAEKRREMLTIREELEKYKKENDELKRRTFNDQTTQALENYREENNELKCKLFSATADAEIRMLEMSKELEKYKLENDDLKQKTTTTQELEMCKKENEELKRDLSSAKELKEENDYLKLQVEKLKLELKSNEEIISKNKELRISLAEMQGEVQGMNIELLNIEQERLEYGKHIGALKDVVRVTKEMLAIRESQIEELKGKIKTVEELLASKEMKIMSDGLREEYERQLRNIRNLRALYEERQRLDKKDKENLQEQLDETKKQVEDEQKKNSELQERVIELEKDTSLKYDTITSLQSNLGLSKAECKELQAEINIINQLFSEILLGFKNTQEIDLDKLIRLLEENHDLLTNMATNEESNSTSAALPKLLLDLINQMNKEDEAVSYENSEIANQASNQLNSAEEIVETLPKVWKVLMELLSHQNPPLNALFGPSQEPCYKLIETSKGAKLKLSVSQTFIRLKDLILEKKFLERETYRLKHLNTHLECRLQDQEKRLELVSGEVKNTWHVVDKMQRQHQQLHTHEKVLRYELQQKRQLLNELKEDLQYCREKWVEARAKNDTTHSQWKELRKEFADRKNKSADDYNQSAESGYSDGKDSSEDERGYESDVSEGKHETDVETDGDQKTETVQINEKRQLVQNDDRLESVATTSVDVVAINETMLGEEVELTATTNLEVIVSEDVASGEEVELTATNVTTPNEDLSGQEIVLTDSVNINEEVASGGVDSRLTGRNSHIEAGTKRLENLLEAREIRLKKMEEIGSQLVSRVVLNSSIDSTSTKISNSNELKMTVSNSEISFENMVPEAHISTPEENHSVLDMVESTNEPHGELTSQHSDQNDESLDNQVDAENLIAAFEENSSFSEDSAASIVASADTSTKNSDFVEASLILDREVQELFDEMCKFVEQGTDTETGNQAEAKLEGNGQVLSAREERLHRLEEEFKEVTEIYVVEPTGDEIEEVGQNLVVEEEEELVSEFDVKNETPEVEHDIVVEEVKVNQCIEAGCKQVTEFEVNELIGNEIQEVEHNMVVEEVNQNQIDNEEKHESIKDQLQEINKASNTLGDNNFSTQEDSIVDISENVLNISERQLPIISTETIYTNTLIISNPGMIIGSTASPLANGNNTNISDTANGSITISENVVNTPSPIRSTEEILMRREERLKRLEAQSQILLAKTRKTNQRSNVICEKLDELHGIYRDSSNEEAKSLNNAREETTRKLMHSRKSREEILLRRETRLRKLDMQCKALLAKILKRTENKNSREVTESIVAVTCKSIVGNKSDSVKVEERNNSISSNPTVVVEDAQSTYINSFVIINDTQSLNLNQDSKCDFVDGDTKTLKHNLKLEETSLEVVQKCAHQSLLTVSEETTSSNVASCLPENVLRRSNDFEAGFNLATLSTETLLSTEANMNCAKEALLKLTNEENFVQLEKRCRGLLVKIRNPHENQFSRRNEEITSELVILLPQLVQSIDDEILALKTLYDGFVDYDDDEEKLDEASAVDFVGVPEELLDVREARFWKLGEQCWEIVNAITVDGSDK